MLTCDRRHFLAATGGLALTGALGRVDRLWAAPRFPDDPFALGVAAGDPWPDGFVIWTRLAPRPLEENGGMPKAAVALQWEVAEDPAFRRVVQHGDTLARPELAHSIHVEVEGLHPRRPYWYRFAIGGVAQSPVGMARTAPAPGDLPEQMRLIVAGCQNYQHGWYSAWRHISEEPDIDAVFHYGDYIYEDGGPSKKVICDASGKVVSRAHLGGETYSLDDYRRRYALYKSDPDLQAAHAAAAFIMSFDDHEVDNNWVGASDQDGTPPEAFLLRRFAAMQAWYEHVPVRRAQFPHADGLTMFRRLDYGALCRIHVLDTRSYRTDQLCMGSDDHHCRTDERPDSTMIGPAQEAWLAEGLRGSTARWNLIAQQVRMMPLVRRGPAGEALPTPTDTWSGYPQARARLVSEIAQAGLTNVIVATGDAHMHNVGTVPMRDDEPDGPAAAVEFMASSISSEGDGAPVTPAIQAYLDGRNPNLVLANHQRGYDRFDIEPALWRTDVKVIDQVQKPGGSAHTLARFAVAPHGAAIVRA
ncbi:alkaline phosphatase [Sphingobium sp. SYK-6]|uniref:alkaline phosphatase D family protein n=1 Tax=Sphingobium sp. (strain NBRC 103272 / SYK-6) TaxID=627192 RepID=UPI0002277383|nr:alkaline phosphatase D family protein [Sphingobium sp. SYK-6]BAK67677.1 alkaline phosphatase [Sphingobium sp. SYK-6]